MAYFVYIAANKGNTVLYTGVTNNVARRMWEHKQGVVKGFTKTYHVGKLLYFEGFPTALEAISAEKKIKGWLRSRKEDLIRSVNPTLTDLSDTL